MSIFWQRLQDVFKRQSRRPSARPFLHSAIEGELVTETELSDWQGSAGRSLLYSKVISAYDQMVASMPSVGDTVHFVSSNGIDGLVVYCRDLDLRHVHYLAMMTEQSQRLQALQYVKNLGDITSQDKSLNIVKTYRYYLKPSIRLVEDGKALQLYGNVTLEYQVVNDEPHLFKVTTTTYSDHKYHSRLAYLELVHMLWAV